MAKFMLDMRCVQGECQYCNSDMGPAQTVRSMTVRFEDVKVQLYAAKAAKASLESDMAKMNQDLGHHKQDQIKSKRLLQENVQLQKLLDGAKAANKVVLDWNYLSRL